MATSESSGVYGRKQAGASSCLELAVAAAVRHARSLISEQAAQAFRKKFSVSISAFLVKECLVDLD